MSMSYWPIVGYGLRLSEIKDYLSEKKVNDLVRKMNPSREYTDNVLLDETFYGDVYSNFAEFLCELDKKSIMNYDDNGEGEVFFLYTPPYPWTASPNEPKTINELEDYITEILQNVYDITKQTLLEHFNYIDTVGWG